TDVEFDPARQRVTAWRRTYFHDLIIEQSVTNIPSDVDTGEILVREAANDFELSNLLNDDARQFLIRIQCLSQWMPELELRVFAAEFIKQLLTEICAGLTPFEQLKAARLLPILQSNLNAKQLAALAREAPSHIAVPSGSRIALAYELGKPPTLSVRIQELF